MKFIISICMLLSSTAFADHHTGFKNGNDLSITTLDGTMYLNCTDETANHSKTVYCSDAFAVPGAVDKFQLAEPVDADKVILSTTRSNGKVITKTEKYNFKKNESKNFNLVISSLFQRPLLGIGTNVVSYTMTKNDDVIAAGTFNATVEVVEQRVCRPQTVFAACSNTTAACDYYFRMQNYCRN